MKAGAVTSTATVYKVTVTAVRPVAASVSKG